MYQGEKPVTKVSDIIQTSKQTDRQRDQPSILCGSKLEQSVSGPAATRRKTAALTWWSLGFVPAPSEDMTATANTQHLDVGTEINIHTPRQLTKKRKNVTAQTESDRYIHPIIQKLTVYLKKERKNKKLSDKVDFRSYSLSQKRKKERRRNFQKIQFQHYYVSLSISLIQYHAHIFIF